MIGINVIFAEKEDRPLWPELDAKNEQGDVYHIENGNSFTIAGISGGMQSGKPSVALRFDLADGKVLVVETSMRLFLSAASAMEARFGDEVS